MKIEKPHRQSKRRTPALQLPEETHSNYLQMTSGRGVKWGNLAETIAAFNQNSKNSALLGRMAETMAFFECDEQKRKIS